jgi:hypothetical protein
MNIKQALKQKNKLAKKIQESSAKISRYNSVDENAYRPYDVNQELNNLITLTNDMVKLKTQIHMANREVYSKIFRLSELKGLVKHLRGVDCTQGVTNTGLRFGESVNPSVKTCVIGRLDMDKYIEQYEAEIDNIQDELDRHNSMTEIQ